MSPPSLRPQHQCWGLFFIPNGMCYYVVVARSLVMDIFG